MRIDDSWQGLSAVVKIMEEKAILICATTAREWWSDLAIGTIEETELLSLFIGSSWSTERTYWQIEFFLWKIKVDGIWMEAV
jgi:hypothetical protein